MIKQTICRGDEAESIGLINKTSNIHLSPCGMTFSPGMTFTEWADKGKEIGTVVNIFVNHIPWWLGDWIIAGEGYFPDKFSQALDETMYSLGRLRNCVYVCKKVAQNDRRSDLSFEHHYQVAKLPADQQVYWLREASINKWNIRQLRAAILGQTVSTKCVPDDISGGMGTDNKTEVVECQLMDAVNLFDIEWDGYAGKSMNPLAQMREYDIAKDFFVRGMRVAHERTVYR